MQGMLCTKGAGVMLTRNPFAGLLLGGHSNALEMLEVFPFLKYHCVVVVG